MSAQGLQAAVEKMQASGMSDVAITSFKHLYHSWEKDESSWIRESDVKPFSDAPCIGDVYDAMDSDYALKALSETAFLKLNGGLGTSMGLSKAKSLLPVRMHKGKNLRFIDIILGQVTATRRNLGVELPLILMNSFRTSKDTLDVIRRNRNFTQTDVPVEIMQHQEPKILADSGMPVTWEKDPELEWCPAGHGDVFCTLNDSGVLDILSKKGIKYLFISNSDNLGARPSSTVAGYFAKTGASFMVEVAQKTAADVKGGHFVIDKKTGRLTLREMSQVHPDDRAEATDITRHPYFNTNNIWVRIDALREKLAECNGILPLPLIRNEKNVDPTDPESPNVIQLETAMGAAIGLFDNSTCLKVDRPRFLPVKTTNDLFIMRSDRFHMTDTYEMEDGNYIFPEVNLDTKYFKNINDFDERFPYSVPSIAAAKAVTVKGDWTFGRGVSFFGDALLEDQGCPSYVPNGEFVGPSGIEPDDWR
ncbi:MAG: UTP--glucose-1-phosphate uridylyltransferase [Bifidobacteriaceae bacterium]|jgi:UTP--glucose-1-phosphate uridylyltransferase|nr:UTP--glucose-1-phosphate uridylyltransferase [Bifidobacteriaceae bacterium]MCI1979341.1 UTP--glucose-1-phosphate uridylyltransferase [Bifidobacteriaceae bacterium]